MKCPGQDTQYWTPGAIFEVKCPACEKMVEFFKDDTARKCSHCGHRFVNPKMDFGCAAYCQYAEQCIGTLPEEYVASQDNLLKDRVAVEMKRYFKADFKRIGHAMRVARHAAAIGADEACDMAVILCAAYLHDIGIHEADRKRNSTAARYREAEGPPIAREILTKLGAKAELIEEVCDIIGHHHHPNGADSINFRVLFDADRLTNLEEKHKEAQLTPERLDRLLSEGFLTIAGRRLAQEKLAVLSNAG